MSEHRPYFILAGVVLAALLADIMLNNAAASLFLMRKTMDMIEWIKFWN